MGQKRAMALPCRGVRVWEFLPATVHYCRGEKFGMSGLAELWVLQIAPLHPRGCIVGCKRGWSGDLGSAMASMCWGSFHRVWSVINVK